MTVWLTGLIALGAGFVLTPVVRAVSRRLGAVARPRKDRWHARPTALFGGVAITGATMAGIGWQMPSLLPHTGLLLLLGCALGMFVLGLIDDIVNLRPAAKLAGQLAVCAAFMLGAPRLVYTWHPVIDTAITIFWLVGITNALNLLDNLDGQSAGVTVVAGSFLVYFFLQGGQTLPALLVAALVGAALAFLVFNWHPASIFMGDCGSLFIGFFLAGVTLFNQTHRTRNLLATLAVPILLLLIPILDTALVALSRRRHGRPVSQGGTDHISHRLVALGLSERVTVLVVLSVAAASGVMAILVRQLPMAAAIAVVPIFLGVVWFGLMVVGRVRVYGSGELAEGGDKPAATEAAGSAPADKPKVGATIFARIELSPGGQVSLVIYDLIAVILCYYLSFLLRFGSNTEPFQAAFVRSLPLVVAVQMLLLWIGGLYRPLWRYGGTMDLLRVGVAVLIAVAGSVAATTLIFRFELLSRAAFAVDALLLFGALAFARFLGKASRLLSRHQADEGSLRTLLYGAGSAGDAALRELREDPTWGLHPIGFIDDDRAKHDRMIHGMRVRGDVTELADIARATRAECVLISTRELPDEKLAEVQRICAGLGLSLRRFSLSVSELPLGAASDERTAGGADTATDQSDRAAETSRTTPEDDDEK